MAQSLPQGLRACQKGHIDPTWPNPLPEAYEHAEQCTSTPDGPPAVPKAHEHGHVDPTSTPHGPPLPSGLRARRMGTTRPNPITKAHEHTECAP
ncbi:hypothetical protein PAXINDRAFT_18064 [Paxillus involutus ATCC 200175]|uniref:Uncharacterized protein n=1 Tax=Paxillus involutus ATCC 200175 TaxID=664439 RepID=A0A0C9SZR0_PAXIN|nr:hypothetical protein PAXINDRAFT_18064 [Paxillus involutus ATCC 200175]